MQLCQSADPTDVSNICAFRPQTLERATLALDRAIHSTSIHSLFIHQLIDTLYLPGIDTDAGDTYIIKELTG